MGAFEGLSGGAPPAIGNVKMPQTLEERFAYDVIDSLVLAQTRPSTERVFCTPIRYS